MELLARAYAAYIEVPNAYTMNNIQTVITQAEDKQLTQAQMVALIKSQPGLGQLRNTSSLAKVLTLGHEGVETFKYVAFHQKDLCPAQISDVTNRPGYLFNQGFCVTAEAVDSLPTVEAGLKGQVAVGIPVYRNVTNYYEGNGYRYSYSYQVRTGSYNTLVDITKPLNGSITDLKSILPTNFNSCGDATNVGDEKLGGLFVNGDASAVFHANDPNWGSSKCIVGQ